MVKDHCAGIYLVNDMKHAKSEIFPLSIHIKTNKMKCKLIVLDSVMAPEWELIKLLIVFSDNTDHILQQMALMNIHGLSNGMDTVPPTDL
jgi:hypothetical protein